MLIARYKALLSSLKNAIFLTLTLRDVDIYHLKEAVDLLHKAFGKLLDTRLGPRALTQLEARFRGVLESSNVVNKDLQLYLFDLFLARVRKMAKAKKNPKLRDVIAGLAKLELVYDADYHVHIHAVFSGGAIPQVLISMLWNEITAKLHPSGKGSFVVDVRRTYKDWVKEVLKYVTKPWEIPKSDHGAVLDALRNRKRFWTFGLVDSPPDRVCECGDPSCRGRYAGKITPDQRLDASTVRGIRRGSVVRGYLDHRDGRDRVEIYADPEGGRLRWRVVVYRN